MKKAKRDISNWQLLEKKRLCGNNWIEVQVYKLRTPAGKKVNYTIVERKNDFSVAIPYENGKFYMIRQYRPAAGVVNLEFPMGYVAGKDPLGMAKQELKEEAGILANKWRKLGEVYPSIGVFTQKAHIFLATELSFGEQDLEENEFIEMVEIKEEKFLEFVIKGEIKGGVTLAAYSLFRLHKDRT